jgi:hypothetical protein
VPCPRIAFGAIHIKPLRGFPKVHVISNAHSLALAADFLVDGQYHFEIGGKGKTHKQIRNLSKAYVVKDDIEIGHENVIPLWLFGFLY